MTFKEMQDECIQTRFKESQRTSIKRWINLRYHMLWALADWPWKRMGPTDLAITLSDTTPTLPTDFDRPLFMYDDLGQELSWMSPDEFDSDYRYVQIQGITGRPEAFKWVNQTITVAPMPNAYYTFSLTYERGMTFISSGGAEVTGELSNNLDTPIWDSPYHYILIPGAIAHGLRVENDPTYPQFEEDFLQLVNSMRDHYLPTLAGSGHLQYGRDEIGTY